MMYQHEFAFRVNDTTVKHITILTRSNQVLVAIRMASRRLTEAGYTVNELVWNKVKEITK